MSRHVARHLTGLLKCSLLGRISQGPSDDPPKFVGNAAHTIVYRVLAVEQCGVVQFIKDDSRMVSYAMSHQRGEASLLLYRRFWRTHSRSPHGRSINQRFAPCMNRRTKRYCFRRAFLGHDKRSALCRICAGDALAVSFHYRMSNSKAH